MTNEEKDLLEQRKVVALEKIATSLNQLTNWVTEIEKQEWGKRIEYYLAEFYKLKNEELGKNIL